MKKVKNTNSKPKNQVSVSEALKPTIRFLKRFNTIIFFLVVSACLFIAIAILLPITSFSEEVAPSAGQTVDSTFDQDTINRLEHKDASSASSYQPGERKSPFTE